MSSFVINPYQFGFAPFEIGLNFRATSGYVTDGTNETYVLASDTYPTTRGGVTFGYTSGMPSSNGRNRSAGVDRRLAGMHFDGGTADAEFRLDLPAAGTYEVRMALGDVTGGNTHGGDLTDGVSTLISIPNAVNASPNVFTDATDVGHTAGNWPNNNNPASVVFSTTTAFFNFVGTGNVCTAHLFFKRTA
jgi:hypothetical protein